MINDDNSGGGGDDDSGGCNDNDDGDDGDDDDDDCSCSESNESCFKEQIMFLKMSTLDESEVGIVYSCLS